MPSSVTARRRPRGRAAATRTRRGGPAPSDGPASQSSLPGSSLPGTSERTSTTTSPRKPWGRRTRATATVSGRRPEASLVEDVELIALPPPRAADAEERTQGRHRPPLPADHLAHVIGRQAGLEDLRPAVLVLRHHHVVGTLHHPPQDASEIGNGAGHDAAREGEAWGFRRRRGPGAS